MTQKFGAKYLASNFKIFSSSKVFPMTRPLAQISALFAKPLRQASIHNTFENYDGKSITDVVISTSDYDQLFTHLLQNDLEQNAFLLCGFSESESGDRLLVRDLLLAQPEDFVVQTSSYLELKFSFLTKVFDLCRQKGFHIVEAHSHPFCREEGVRFSSIDWASQRDKMSWYAEKWPESKVAELVFGHNSIDGHCLESEHNQITPLRSLKVVGPRGFTLTTTSWAECLGSQQALDRIEQRIPAQVETGDSPFARQELAFGQAGQNQIARATVGLVGCGGLGSIIVQQLTHLGVRNWRLIDPDVIEASNLNRVAFSLLEDAEHNRPKVEVMERGIRSIAPDAQVKALVENVSSEAARLSLRDVDLIVSAPDNDGARLLANEIATAYLIPILDMGTGLNVESGAVAEAGGQLVWRFPGEGCLHCAGAIDSARAAIDLMNNEEQTRHEARYGTSSPQPAVMFLNGVVVSLAVGEITKWLTGFAPPQQSLFYDAIASSVTRLAAAGKDPQCGICHRDALYGAGDAAFSVCKENAFSSVPMALLDYEAEGLEPVEGGAKDVDHTR